MSKNQKQAQQQYKMNSNVCAGSIGVLALTYIIAILICKFTRLNISESGFGLLLSITFLTSVIAIITSGHARFFLKRTHGSRHVNNIAKPLVAPVRLKNPVRMQHKAIK